MSDETQINETPATYDVGSTDLVMARNGVLRDPNTGRIVAHSDNVTSSITPATATEYHRMRQVKQLRAQQAAASGMGRFYAETVGGKASSLAAWAQIAYNMADLATNKRDRVAVEAARTVGKMAGFMDDSRRQAPADGNVGATITLSQQATARLLEILAAREQGE